ncbi:general substrate transporter [Lipomyces orientalis]|uniref:General substrate transporter n=1 Tax=Lipomyces orientalis TaxID=1233043 RepID=A0ACC3TKD3_9ASCO
MEKNSLSPSSGADDVPTTLEPKTTYALNEDLYSNQLTAIAKSGAEVEQHLPPLKAIKAYPMAVFWSLVVSMCVIMEGYDTSLIGNFFAYPSFAQKFGHYVPGAGYQLTAAWQAGFQNATGVGSFFGVIANGYLVGWFGHKRVLIGALFAMSAFIFIMFFAQNIQMLTAGGFLCGLPWGVFASASPAYASEVLPLSLRVYFTSYTNMCFIIGQLIAAGVLEGLVKLDSEWGYRIPYALQWVWPCILIPLMFFAPESPWHLVRKGKLEEAEVVLRRLQSKTANIDPKLTLATIVHTNKLEQELEVGSSYWDCFRGFELRRTEIACIVFSGQITCGICFAYNSTYFFQQVGLTASQTYKLNVGGTALALVGTFVNWFVIAPRFGRRSTYICGLAVMTSVLFIIGILNVWTEKKSVGMSQAILTLLWTFTFQLSVGQLGWALPAEIGSTRLRQKTVCLARNTYYLVGFLGVLQPYFMNPNEWNLKGYTGFVWGGTALLTLIWAFYRLPETKDRPFNEIDILFAKGVPARKFKDYKIDPYDMNQNAELAAEAHAHHHNGETKAETVFVEMA